MLRFIWFLNFVGIARRFNQLFAQGDVKQGHAHSSVAYFAVWSIHVQRISKYRTALYLVRKTLSQPRFRCSRYRKVPEEGNQSE